MESKSAPLAFNIQFVLIYLLSFINFCQFYFLDYNAITVIITGITTLFLFLLVFVLIKRNYSDGLYLLIFFLFLFPKRPQKPEAACLINNFFGNTQELPYFYFEVIFISILTISFSLNYFFLKPTKKQPLNNSLLFFLKWVVIFAIIGFFYNLTFSNSFFPRSYWILIISGTLLAILPFFLIQSPINKTQVLKNSYAYAKLLIIILGIEFFLLQIRILPTSISSLAIDFKEGYRGLLFGYSVIAGFYLLLSFMIIFYQNIIQPKRINLLLMLICLIIIAGTYDRNPLLAALFFLVMYILFYGKKVVKILFFGFITLTISFNQVLNSLLSSSAIRRTDYFDSGSLIDRLVLQIRAINVFFTNFIFGYGANTFQWIYKKDNIKNVFGESFISNDQYYLFFSLMNNELGNRAANAHNLFIQKLPELGILGVGFIIFYLILPIKLFFRNKIFIKSNKEIGVLFFIFFSLIFFYLFQSTPDTTYLLTIILMMIFQKIKYYTK